MERDSIDLLALKAQLAGRGWRQLDLARKLGHPLTTVNGWLIGVHPGPADLRERIERILGLDRDALGVRPDGSSPAQSGRGPARRDR